MKRALVLLLLAGCAGSSGPSDAGAPFDAGSDAGADAGSFIALAGDFDGFRGWQQYVVQDPTSSIWDRTVWISDLPPHGASAFPVRTRIVREFVDPTSATGYTLHAMAKRGGGFNAQDGGAHGWEWFEITDNDGGDVSIVWRGEDQPDGGPTYNGSNQSCNQCHVSAEANDYVQTPALQLSGF